MAQKIKSWTARGPSRRKSPKSKKRVTFSNKPFGGKSDYYEPGKYPFNSAQFFKKSNITTVPLVKKANVTATLSAKNVKPVSILKNSNSKSKTNSKSIGGRVLQDPANAIFTSNALKTTNARGTVIDTDKFNRQWSVRKQYANYPLNAGIYASSMPAAKSNTGGRRSKKSYKKKGGNKAKSHKKSRR